MTNNEFYNKIINMLPHKLKDTNNALRLKKILKIIGDYVNNDRNNDIKYNLLLSISDISGIQLDMYGDMFYMYRNNNESDDDFRNRIFETVALRTVGSNIKDMQSILDIYIKNGKLRIIENPYNRCAKIALSGNVDAGSFKKAFSILENMTPSGVGVLVPIATYDTWGDLYRLNPKWSDVSIDKFVW